MKILFLNPLRFTERTSITSNLITAYISTPSLTFAQLASYIPGNEMTIIDGQVENLSLEEFLNRLKGVDVVALSIHASYGARDCEVNIRVIKKYYPRIKIIMGGYHATFFYKRWLELGVNFVLLYEGERYFKELIECLEKGKDYRNIKNLAYKDNGKVMVNEIGPMIDDLDSIPMPRFDLINFKNYFAFFPGDKEAYAGSIELSRGCQHRCDFCLTSRFWDYRYRRKSNQRVLREIQTLVDMNIKKIWFYTASFGTLPDEDYALCELIEKSGLKINWRVPIRMDTVLEFPELIKKSASVGMKLALVGYESFSNEAITAFDKKRDSPYNYENFKKAYHILRGNDILVEGSFIVGYPGESESEEVLSPKKLDQVSDFIAVQVYRPNVALLPEILNKEPDNEDYKRLFYFDPYLSDDLKLKKIVLRRMKIRIKYYFNPLYICSRLFLRGSLIRGLYLCYYVFFTKNLFKRFTLTIMRNKDTKFTSVT